MPGACRAGDDRCVADHRSACERLRTDERGVFLAWFGLMLVVFFGFAALAIDVGSAYWKKRDLQSAMDAATLAAGANLPCLDNVNPPSGTSCPVSAQTIAKQYLAKNGYDPAGFSFDYGCMPQGASDKQSCAPRFDYFQINPHTVISPNVFAQVAGGPSHFDPTVGTTAACNPCSTDTIDFDIMIVLDRSGSMCQDANGLPFAACNDLTAAQPSDLANAKNGLLEFIKFFNPVPDSNGHYDRVGFVVLPGFNPPGNDPANPTAPTFNSGSPGSSNYCGAGTANTTAPPGNPSAGAPGNWMIVPLRPTSTPLDSTWKWLDPTTNALNDQSRLVSAIKCVPGEGGTVMNEAARAADMELSLHGRTCSTCRRIVVYFGDGGGNQYNNWSGQWASQTLNSTFDKQHPCGSTVWNNVDADTKHGPQGWGGRSPWTISQGIQWYSIGYALDFNPSGNSSQRCVGLSGGTNPETYDNASLGISGAVSSGLTMQLLATNDQLFYNQPTPGNLYAIFNAIGHRITDGGVRLVK
jgi:hypothetical protein